MILRLQNLEELQKLEARIKEKSKNFRVHMTELRSNTGFNAAPQDNKAGGSFARSSPLTGPSSGPLPNTSGPAVAAPLKTPSKTRQKRSQRIPGYMAESDVLKSILGYLRLHPKVSWVVRINSGALRYENRFIKFGQPGFPDVIGMTKTGILIGIEVKASNGHASPEQLAFIARIQKDRGLGCIAKSIEDVKELLEPFDKGGHQG